MELLTHLRQRGPLSARDVTQQMGVSAATLSRAFARTEGVARRGQAQRTVYFATRELAGLGTGFELFAVDDTGRPSATGQIAFSYGGGSVVERASGRVTTHRFAPWFIEDARPQGFLGRAFLRQHHELGLPRLNEWREDDVYRAAAHQGHDLPGALLVGAPALERFLQIPLHHTQRDDYPAAAVAALQGDLPGSSAGGEQPKFTAFVAGRWVIVKFSPDAGESAQRIADLLVCEHLALDTLRDAQLPASETEIVRAGGRTFLEVTRFDRVGPKGRRAVVTMACVEPEFVSGRARTWSEVAHALVPQKRLPSDDARTIAKLDAYSRLLMNSDAHLGNLALFWDFERDRFTVAPAYDVSPMRFAPNPFGLPTEVATPLPDARTLDVWDEMKVHAHTFWTRVLDDGRISAEFKERCARPSIAAIE